MTKNGNIEFNIDVTSSYPFLFSNYVNLWGHINNNDTFWHFITSGIDHGRSEEPGPGANWKKIAHFEKLENPSSVFQNGLAFLW